MLQWFASQPLAETTDNMPLSCLPCQNKGKVCVLKCIREAGSPMFGCLGYFQGSVERAKTRMYTAD